MNKIEILMGYCNKSWKIFPVKEKDKTPAINNWINLATNNKKTIVEWYKENNNYNWGLATGEIIVIDIDPKNGGSLEDIELPETLRVKTGSGGYHLYYKNSAGKDIRNSVSKLSKGIDIRGYGGYVVLPPSIHPNGNSYEWENEIPLSEFPYELLGRMDSKEESKSSETPSIIEEGKRNDTLFRLGSSLRSKGLSKEAIFEALRVENKERCIPPIDDIELENIVDSVSKYEQGEIALDGNSTEFTLTDLGNAERLVIQHGKNIKYCPSFGWLIWDGKRWKADKTEIYKLAHETAKGIYLEASQTKDTLQSQKLGDWAKNSLSRYRIDSMVDMAKPYVTIPSEDLDNHPFYLNVRNGVIDLRTGKLLPHNPEYLLTKVVDINFNPQATGQKWLEFLDMIFPADEELHKFIKKAVGYSLTGNTDEQCIFFLHGEGENGKSTFVEVIQSLLGEYALKTDVDVLMYSNRGGVTPYLAEFFKKRFIFTTETEEGIKFNDGRIKNLTGGDTITANPKYKDAFTFRPTHKIWMFGNHKPEVRDMTHGFWRRMKLIPFEIKIPKEKQRSMSEVLGEFQEEIEGILNWAIEGCLLWQREGLNTPEKVKNATEEYKGEQDLFSQFLQEECELSPEYKIKKSDLLASYNEYLFKCGEKSKVSKRYMGDRLVEKGITAGGDGKSFYIGVRKHFPKDTVENDRVEALFGGKLMLDSQK